MLSGVDRILERAPLVNVDVHVDADLGQLGLDHLGGTVPHVSGYVHLKIQPVPKACFCQKLLGLFQILGIRLHFLIPPRQGLCNEGAGHLAAAFYDRIHKFLAVHGICNGLAHPDVIQSLFRGIERHEFH